MRVFQRKGGELQHTHNFGWHYQVYKGGKWVANKAVETHYELWRKMQEDFDLKAPACGAASQALYAEANMGIQTTWAAQEGNLFEIEGELWEVLPFSFKKVVDTPGATC